MKKNIFFILTFFSFWSLINAMERNTLIQTQPELPANEQQEGIQFQQHTATSESTLYYSDEETSSDSDHREKVFSLSETKSINPLENKQQSSNLFTENTRKKNNGSNLSDLTCNVCRKVFTCKYNVLQHKEYIHFMCRCTQSCQDLQDLQNHITLSHPDRKKVYIKKCDFCDTKFKANNKFNLTKRQMHHLNKFHQN